MSTRYLVVASIGLFVTTLAVLVTGLWDWFHRGDAMTDPTLEERLEAAIENMTGYRPFQDSPERPLFVDALAALREKDAEIARLLAAIEALREELRIVGIANDSLAEGIKNREASASFIQAKPSLAEARQKRLRRAVGEAKREILMPIGLWAAADKKMLPRPHLMSPAMLIEIADCLDRALSEGGAPREE